MRTTFGRLVTFSRWAGDGTLGDGTLMGTYGFYSGPIDYWMLFTDWRAGSITIMLAIGALIAGYAFRTGSP
jgi:hypothetical protein